MYSTDTKASVPKEFVRDCRSQRNDKLKLTVRNQRRRTKNLRKAFVGIIEAWTTATDKKQSGDSFHPKTGEQIKR